MIKGINNIIKEITRETKNQIILGLNGSGKTTIAKMIKDKQPGSFVFSTGKFTNIKLLNGELVLSKSVSNSRKKADSWYGDVYDTYEKILFYTPSYKIKKTIMEDPFLFSQSILKFLESNEYKNKHQELSKMDFSKISFSPEYKSKDYFKANLIINNLVKTLNNMEGCENIAIPNSKDSDYKKQNEFIIEHESQLWEYAKNVIKDDSNFYLQHIKECPLCLKECTEKEFKSLLEGYIKRYEATKAKLSKINKNNKEWADWLKKIKNSKFKDIKDYIKKEISITEKDWMNLASDDVDLRTAACLKFNAINEENKIGVKINFFIKEAFDELKKHESNIKDYHDWYTSEQSSRIKENSDKINSAFMKFIEKYKIIDTKEFKIINKDKKSHEIVIKNESEYNITNVISYGEQKILELIFTLVSFSNSKPNSILILDDPVDSNDDINSVITCQILSKIINENKNIKIFTHNKNFVNELLKYISGQKNKCLSNIIIGYILENNHKKSTEIELKQVSLNTFLYPWEKIWGYYDNNNKFNQNEKYTIEQYIVWTIMSREYFRISGKIFCDNSKYKNLSDFIKQNTKNSKSLSFIYQNAQKYSKIYNDKNFPDNISNIIRNDPTDFISFLELLQKSQNLNTFELNFLKVITLRIKLSKINDTKLAEYEDILNSIIHSNLLSPTAAINTKRLAEIENFIKQF